MDILFLYFTCLELCYNNYIIIILNSPNENNKNSFEMSTTDLHLTNKIRLLLASIYVLVFRTVLNIGLVCNLLREESFI